MSINKTSLTTNTIIFLFISGIIVGIVLGGITGYIWGQNKAQEKSHQSAVQEGKTDNVFVEAEEKYNQSGQITKINDNTILFKGQASINGSLQETDFTVQIDENTIYKKFNLSDSKQKAENISINDLAKEDNITVLSNEDIKDKTEFTAKQINLYIND